MKRVNDDLASVFEWATYNRLILNGGVMQLVVHFFLEIQLYDFRTREKASALQLINFEFTWPFLTECELPSLTECELIS